MTKIDPTSKKIALARIAAYSDQIKIHIGGQSTFTRTELLSHVRNETEVGQKIVAVEIEFLRDLAQGKIYQDA